jgi:7-carboxy-7-deazaguanine synthase
MIALNKQRPENKVSNELLQVVKIWRTIQGEGPYVGMPAVFVRLAGCNLMCPLCDTDYTSVRNKMSFDIIARDISIMSCPDDIVVLSGGEPFRQDITQLCRRLHELRFRVQIETNGTTFREDFFQELGNRRPKIVCSPKTVINRDLEPYIDAFKYVIRSGDVDPEDGLPTHALDNRAPVQRPTVSRPIYLQPCDEGDPELNALNMKTAVESCLRYGHILCLQMHKIAGLE